MRISATPMRKYAYQGGTFILFISYFRLADYLQPLEDNHSLHTFKSDATFEDAVTLYYFDKELRSLIFTAIQSIEIALRSKMINHCALRYGAHWFMDFEWFKDRSIFTLS